MNKLALALSVAALAVFARAETLVIPQVVPGSMRILTVSTVSTNFYMETTNHVAFATESVANAHVFNKHRRAGARVVLISVEGHDVYAKFDGGVAHSATGQLISAGTKMVLPADTANKARYIRAGGTNATLVAVEAVE